MKRVDEKMIVKIALGALLGLIFIYALFHHFSKPILPAIPLPEVTVTTPKMRAMTDYITQTGTTVAYNSVDLVARVEGYLERIEFTDGTLVSKGQPLFVIQPEPYMEQLKAAQATVAAQRAAYAYSKSEYARQVRMLKDHATSQNNVESWFAKMHENEAEVDKAVANEAIAAITYSYTHVSSPFTGRIGRHRVDLGNLVGNGVATNLATVEQIIPLYVYFNLNELDFLKLRQAAKAAGFQPSDLKEIMVDISLQNENNFNHHARMDFINTGLNASTGTMEFRAILDNQDLVFVPGLFVQVRVAISKPAQRLTIPSTAILYDQIGPYLLLVDKNDVVELQRVTLGVRDQNNQSITEGLKATDRVIIDGMQRATPGNKVAPKAAS